MTQKDLLYLLLGLGVIWTAIWLSIITGVHQVEDEQVVDRKTASLRRRLILPLSVVLLVGMAFSFYWMPYSSIRGRTIGQPEMTIDVVAIQWGWIMKEQTIPANKSVEFTLTSKDVNHDFSIYSPDGDLLTQAQVMPGYTNKLIYKFDKPGIYTVRCLEYCGVGHDIMVATFTVA